MASRLRVHARVADLLAGSSDAELVSRVHEGRPRAPGVGGATARLDLGGVPVFVKRVALTDLERRPEHWRSTANIFGLPAFCHYGLANVASPGFSAWRELAASLTASEWVEQGRCTSFPLLHHWRVLPGPPLRSGDHHDVHASVAAWGGSCAVRERIEAVARSSAQLVLFFEFIPATVEGWLREVLHRWEAEEAAAACAVVARELRAVMPFMATHGLIHFDAHLRNVLTDGVDLFVADPGLAAAVDFELDDDERALVSSHATYDAANSLALLVYSVVSALSGEEDWQGRFALIRRWAQGQVPASIPAPVAAVIGPYAPLAVVMNTFAARVMRDPTAASYPLEQVAAAYQAAIRP